jgi:GTP-binding protein HflX
VRGWTHLERQKGGIGLRGPGETQLETDRRLIGKRIRTLAAKLETLAQRRDTGRQVRKRVPVPGVALIGYTNAGKSTLFSALTGRDAYVADQLFATLDPTVRRCDCRIRRTSSSPTPSVRARPCRTSSWRHSARR